MCSSDLIREAVQVSQAPIPRAVDIGSLPEEPTHEPTLREAVPLEKEPIRKATFARTGRSSCNPPFTLDVFGIKRIKLRCL